MIALDVMVYPGSTPDPGPADSPYAPAQKAWLEADLAAVNRSQTPWILAFAHHPLYCSSTTMGAGTSESAEGEATVLFDSARGGPEPGELTDAQKARIPKGKGYAGCLGTGVVGVEARADLEPILEAHGVDMFLAGHEHDYESIWPVKDCAIGSKNCYIGTSFDSPKATVHVVCGEGGEGDLPPSSPPPCCARAHTHTHTHTHTHLPPPPDNSLTTVHTSTQARTEAIILDQIGVRGRASSWDRIRQASARRCRRVGQRKEGALLGTAESRLTTRRISRTSTS
jgi:hypothetical protein